MMTTVLGILIGALIGSVIGHLIARLLRPVLYKREWVESGERWKRDGLPRFHARARWIQRYFDEGYDKAEREESRA